MILIESTDETLALAIQPREADGYLCTLYNRATGEIREQLVEALPPSAAKTYHRKPARWRKTVQQRMDRIHPDMQTPLVLLKGIR